MVVLKDPRKDNQMKWTGKGKYPPEQERERKRAQKEERSARRHRLYMQAVKDKLDLWGEDSLNVEEKELVRLAHDFFYPPVVPK